MGTDRVDEPGRTRQVCVLAASPRRGASVALADQVARGVEDAGLDARVLRLCDLEVAGCVGCGACERTGACVLDARDDMPRVRAALEESCALAVVAPVYFAGPTSQFKALLDRMQPLWAQRYLLGAHPLLPRELRKPLDLFVVGTGGDPFGYEPLVTCARSALRMADYELGQVRDCVGYAAPATPAERNAAWERSARLWGDDLAARSAAASAPACTSLHPVDQKD